MSVRRGLCCLAVLVSAAAGGCTATVSGHGSLAASVQTPGGDDAGGPTGGPTGHPTAQPSRRPTPTGSGPATGPGGADAAGTGAVCALFTVTELTALFGEPVTRSAPKDNDHSCNFQTGDHGGVLVSVYDFLNMQDEAARDPGGRKLTIAGHPAYQGKREVLVSRSSTPSAAGLIVASNLFLDNEAKGNQVAERLLEKVVPKFSK